MIREVGDKFNLETVIFRPASTIGMRDRVSFFTQLYRAYQQGRFLLARHNQGRTRISLIDTRDLGRAMVWLGALTEAANKVYLGKGFDVCWHDLQGGSRPQSFFTPWPPWPSGSRLPQKPSLTHDVVIDDSKLKHTGFQFAMYWTIVSEWLWMTSGNHFTPQARRS